MKYGNLPIQWKKILNWNGYHYAKEVKLSLLSLQTKRAKLFQREET